MDALQFIIICILFVAFFVSGFFIGQAIIMTVDFTYQDASIKTCEYANKLTDIVNNQSALLEKCAGEKENDLTRLDYLNCSRLK